MLWKLLLSLAPGSVRFAVARRKRKGKGPSLSRGRPISAPPPPPLLRRPTGRITIHPARMAAAASSGRGGGGSVFDLADTLLESLQQASGGGADPRVAGAACGKGPAEPPEAASTISLLEDCLECLWRGGSAREPSADASRSGASQGGGRGNVGSAAAAGGAGFLPERAGRRGLRRQEGHPLPVERGEGRAEVGSDSPPHQPVRPKCAKEDKDAGGFMDGDAIAAGCMEAFLREIKELKAHHEELRTPIELSKFGAHCEEKYLRLRLDRLPPTAKVKRIKGIISKFIGKLDPVGCWNCAICSKRNSASRHQCQVCGRKRGQNAKARKRPKLVRVPVMSKLAREKARGKTGLERRKDLFLKQKADYEEDQRQEVAEEIQELLQSVKDGAP